LQNLVMSGNSAYVLIGICQSSKNSNIVIQFKLMCQQSRFK
jgi:hypothetical protein